MKVVFISNYFNHHQKPFLAAMFNLLGENFCFIETEPMENNTLYNKKLERGY